MPAGRIPATARRIDADLIVPGRRGLDSLEGMMHGRVSRRAAHDAPCHCITVK